MAGRKYSEFTDKTKRTLAGRAGYQCSHPDCKLFLIGPHTNGGKTVSLGVAAHIKGAAPGSARYDPDQTDTQRKHISNGLWMCWNHSVQIDHDVIIYSVEALQEWKRKREEEAHKQFAKPVNTPIVDDGWGRPEPIHRLDTDGKYRRGGLVVSYDPWLHPWFTMVKLSVEGEIDSPNEIVHVAVNSVKAYMASVGLRGPYLHILAQMRDQKLHAISSRFPSQWKQQFDKFLKNILELDWSDTPGIEGAVFDLVAGDVKGTGEWDYFMIDITCLYPDLYAHYIDSK